MLTGVRLKAKVKPFSKLVSGVSHKYRLAIIYLLAHGPLPTHEIVADIDLPQNLVAHHLKALREAGWVTRERAGREVTYQLNEKAFKDLIKLIAETTFWRRLLLKFKRS